jgi:hypothetical protein
LLLGRVLRTLLNLSSKQGSLLRATRSHGWRHPSDGWVRPERGRGSGARKPGRFLVDLVGERERRGWASVDDTAWLNGVVTK